MDCSENDEEALFALSLLYATIANKGYFMARFVFYFID